MNIQSVETHYSFDARDNKKKVNKNTKFSLFLFFVNVDQDARKKLKSGTRNPTVKLEKEEKKRIPLIGDAGFAHFFFTSQLFFWKTHRVTKRNDTSYFPSREIYTDAGDDDII